MTNDLKLKIYPAVIGVLGLCLLASLLFNVEIQVEQGVAPEKIAPPSRRSPSVPSSASPNSPSSVPSSSDPIAEPQAPVSVPDASPTESPALVESGQVGTSVGADVQGSLRVSNQTDYPLRVALLHHQAGFDELDVAVEDEQTFGQPVHWDFAPGEGRAKGLILSLPTGELQLQSGDVLVAFAQDGSRRYWGPYVVGKTSVPVWNAATNEWQLILRP